LLPFLSFLRLRAPRDLHSFPTRRSSDLDLLGLYKLTSVAPGDVLAVVHPGVKGKPGRTVKGREVPVTEPRSVQLKVGAGAEWQEDRKSTRLNSSHVKISYAVFCLKKKSS